MTNEPLSLSALREAARAVSAAGKVRYTPRNLYYELVRKEALAGWPAGP